METGRIPAPLRVDVRIIPQFDFYGRNSADVTVTESHSAIIGRCNFGYRRSGIRTGAGNTRSQHQPRHLRRCGCAGGPTPLSTFVLTGPLQWLPPATFDAGPLGKLSVNGIVTGFSQFQNNSVPGDDSAQATLSNGQIFIQKADGKVQYYIQAGVYTMPTLSVPFVNAQNTVNNFYGPVPVAYLKLQAGKTTQFLIGSLPTLMGAESTFTYQNFNIERGIVWNQENAINRGIQVNQTLGKYLTRLAQLERRLLFQPLLVALGLGDLYEGAS